MVTLIEKEHLGGTCLNIGCIPTKCLLHSAELVEDIKNQGRDIGVKVTGVEVDFPQVIAHKNDISKKITGGVIGLELACAYAAFGTKITVVKAMDHPCWTATSPKSA